MTWLGPVTWDGQHAPFCVCEPCLAAIERRAQRHFLLHRPDPDAPAAFRQHSPAAAPITLTRNAMEHVLPQLPPLGTSVRIEISALGVRASADGATGRAAWRVIRQQHPRVARAAVAYAAVMAAVGVLLIVRGLR
ncbi:hypothetical protein ACH4C2_16715 [Streptomyces sp. NPDC018057]|uniref:hypothetical protein n=1 Tax=unclassified Streptomyces TaxID=2593676 RepID=UPI0037A3B346